MSYKVIVSESFKKHFKAIHKKHRSLKSDVLKLVELLEKNPIQGTPIGKDCYKIRLAISSKGKGKSGGSRVITCLKIENNTIYLLAIFDKSEKESITDKELDMLLKIAGILK